MSSGKPHGRRKRPLDTASQAVKDAPSVPILSRRFLGLCYGVQTRSLASCLRHQPRQEPRALTRMRGGDLCGGTGVSQFPTAMCVRLTDASVTSESLVERKGSHHFHPEPCAGHREVPGEASVGACAGRAIEPRNAVYRMCRDCPNDRRQHFTAALG